MYVTEDKDFQLLQHIKLQFKKKTSLENLLIPYKQGHYFVVEPAVIPDKMCTSGFYKSRDQ